jgi:hypothetical protein
MIADTCKSPRSRTPIALSFSHSAWRSHSSRYLSGRLWLSVHRASTLARFAQRRCEQRAS